MIDAFHKMVKYKMFPYSKSFHINKEIFYLILEYLIFI